MIVRATLASGSKRELQVMMSQAYPRFSTQWATDPFQQLCYLAVRKWARLNSPGSVLGVYTPEELDAGPTPEKFMGAADVVGAPPPPPPAPKTEEKPAFTEAHLKERAMKIAEFYAKGKTADEIVAFYSAKSTVSPEMAKRIRDMDPKAAAQDVTPKVTYAALADRLHKCDDPDTASVILDEGRALPADQQQELAAIYTAKFQPQG